MATIFAVLSGIDFLSVSLSYLQGFLSY
ncbi:hypothetical protein A583_13603 [Corynebacterium glutamicum Z188]|uniref:Uncharacterized protein n=1 Tax=Corynebacterium glutamicum (strain R) TaxID=340322 RepID=A0AB72VEC1_CORGB|nr:hypothetical protein C624_14075 [Corynebacterium glutamicum SCgG1]AGN23406.1 hypothetical protein C629_14080 [Corynebacterium glutamicum SCgG2]EPP39463.1 hypothetical protein A583_13603 [Corynebacterium glutamicum Z188]BAF55777.1 hypothetical protein cgR_2758 [Corynebacterium glutamicum R]